jgi:hypothetical protein
MGVNPEARDLPPGSQPWKRHVDKQLEDHTTAIARSNQDIANAISGLSNTVQVLGEQIKAFPIVRVLGNTQEGFTLNGTFQSIARVSFYVPAGKTKAQVFVSADATALDTVSGGLTGAEGRINWSGLVSHTFSASKDAGASAVNNLVMGSHFYNVNLIPGARYTIAFEMRGLNPSAFPAQKQNYANINVVITHTG